MIKNKDLIIGFRANPEFASKFDELCERLGFNRSNVIRYVTKRFLNETWNNSDNFKRARAELY